ncbi:hypothetical protein EYF80_001752 [Liparis tanakae]|uniref:Uncharacterized protein n=1 Tax=Liparis tanakae TaxID=230148 RepID=A0A4Z2JDS8_9TELE|nr:hypothetical protein EYF80_001752 [Liparis tanakae]
MLDLFLLLSAADVLRAESVITEGSCCRPPPGDTHLETLTWRHAPGGGSEGPKAGTQNRDPEQGPRTGTQYRDPVQGPRTGTQNRDPEQGPPGDSSWLS